LEQSDESLGLNVIHESLPHSVHVHGAPTVRLHLLCHILLKLTVEQVDLNVARLVVIIFDGRLLHVRVVIFFHLICFSYVLELVGLESVHDLLTHATCPGVQSDVSFHQRGVLHVRFDLHKLFLSISTGGKLECKLDIVPELLLKSIDNGVDVELHFLRIQGCTFAVVGVFVVGILDVGERGLSVSLVLFGSDALILDDVADADDDFDELDEGEEHQQNQGYEKLYDQVGVKDDEKGSQDYVPQEKLSDIYHLYYLPSILQLGVFAPNLGIQTLGAPRYIVDSAKSIDVQEVEVGGRVKEERKGSRDYLVKILDPHEENAVEGQWKDVEEHRT
jgi:hypothetical protein